MRARMFHARYILTKMAVYFYINKVSKEQSIIPTLFQLVDDKKKIVTLTFKFILPNADDALLKFLKEFSLNVMWTSQVRGNFGVSCSLVILNNLK